MSSKEIEKKSKYKNLEIEIQMMLKMKTEVIPIVIGALSTIKKEWKITSETSQEM